MVDGYDQRGVVRFAGVHHANGNPRYGVELSAPVGNNDGTVKGNVYFTCAEKHGVLVSTSKVVPWSNGEAFSVAGSGATIAMEVGGKNVGSLSDLGELVRVKKGTPEGNVKRGYIGKRVYQFQDNKDVFCIADKKTGAVTICDRMFKETPTGRQYAWSMAPDHPHEGKFEDRESWKITKWAISAADGIQANKKLRFIPRMISADAGAATAPTERKDSWLGEEEAEAPSASPAHADPYARRAAEERAEAETQEAASSGGAVVRITKVAGMKVGLSLGPGKQGSGPVVRKVGPGSLADGKIEVNSIILSINSTSVVGSDMKAVLGMIKSSQVLDFVFDADLAPMQAAASPKKAAGAAAAAKETAAEPAAAAAATPPAADGFNPFISITKVEGAKVGIALTKGEGDAGPKIKKVTPGTLSAGKVEVGWEIQSLNGTPLAGKDMKAIQVLIRDSQVLNFVIAPMDGSKAVSVTKVPGKSVGLKLKKNPNGDGPAVSSVTEGSLAADGNINAGDVIRSINGVNVLKATTAQVATLIKSGDTLDFVFEPKVMTRQESEEFSALAGLLGGD